MEYVFSRHEIPGASHSVDDFKIEDVASSHNFKLNQKPTSTFRRAATVALATVAFGSAALGSAAAHANVFVNAPANKSICDFKSFKAHTPEGNDVCVLNNVVQNCKHMNFLDNTYTFCENNNKVICSNDSNIPIMYSSEQWKQFLQKSTLFANAVKNARDEDNFNLLSHINADYAHDNFKTLSDDLLKIKLNNEDKTVHITNVFVEPLIEQKYRVGLQDECYVEYKLEGSSSIHKAEYHPDTNTFTSVDEIPLHMGINNIDKFSLFALVQEFGDNNVYFPNNVMVENIIKSDGKIYMSAYTLSTNAIQAKLQWKQFSPNEKAFIDCEDVGLAHSADPMDNEEKHYYHRLFMRQISKVHFKQPFWHVDDVKAYESGGVERKQTLYAFQVDGTWYVDKIVGDAVKLEGDAVNSLKPVDKDSKEVQGEYSEFIRRIHDHKMTESTANYTNINYLKNKLL